MASREINGGEKGRSLGKWSGDVQEGEKCHMFLQGTARPPFNTANTDLVNDCAVVFKNVINVRPSTAVRGNSEKEELRPTGQHLSPTSANICHDGLMPPDLYRHLTAPSRCRPLHSAPCGLHLPLPQLAEVAKTELNVFLQTIFFEVYDSSCVLWEEDCVKQREQM